MKTLKTLALGCLFALSLSAQIQLPYTYQARTPSPNAPSGSCFINTTPVYNYVLGQPWYCVPNTGSPTNLGTWTQYSLPTGVLGINASGQLASATGAQITAAASAAGTLTQSIVLPLTLSQLQTLFTVGVQILPAPAATSLYVMGPCALNLTYGSAAFTAGGAVSIGYGATFASTTPSPLTHGTIAATVFTTFSASHAVVLIPASVAVTADTTMVGKPVFMSAATQDFAGGTGASGQVSCQYSVMTGVQ